MIQETCQQVTNTFLVEYVALDAQDLQKRMGNRMPSVSGSAIIPPVSRMMLTQVGQSLQQGLEQLSAVHNIGCHHHVGRMPAACQLRCLSDAPHEWGSSCTPARRSDGGAVQGYVLPDYALQDSFAESCQGLGEHQMACRWQAV